MVLFMIFVRGRYSLSGANTLKSHPRRPVVAFLFPITVCVYLHEIYSSWRER